jgi:hypothetical protein
MARRLPPGADSAGKPFIVSGASAFDEAPAVLRQWRARCIRSADKPSTNSRRDPMSKKQKLPVAKPTRKIADARRVRFGGGCAPRVIRSLDKATQDSGAVRFGGGCAPASLRK